MIPGTGPRIYNLFPLAAGITRDWISHLPRIADMEFNWVYLNPFHTSGFSGSLYAVKDYYELNPLFDDDSGRSQDEQLSEFTAQGKDYGLSIMMDLVINHTAKDSLLTESHPHWFLYDEDGELESPGAVDPDDPSVITVWEDLAEIDYSERPDRDEIVDYWQQLVRHYVGLGFKGFRCDAAYKVPAEVWGEIISAAREIDPDATFMAETLGCSVEDVHALRGAGFNYLFNSSKWWNFEDSWLLGQYEAFRHIAPSIAFPESHDTPRLAAELGDQGIPPEDLEAHYRLRYSFAASFSAGVMMPMGYEFGYRKSLHVVETRPDTPEIPLFDLSDFIAITNRTKAAVSALNEEGPQVEVSPPWSPAIALLRQTADSTDWALVLINPLPDRNLRLRAADLQVEASLTGREVTPGGEAVELREASRLVLKPLEVRIFQGHGEAVAPATGKSATVAKKTTAKKTGAAKAGKKKASTKETAAMGDSSAPHTVKARFLETVRTNSIIIEDVCPQVDCGKYPVKRVVGDTLEVSAKIYREGHDKLAAVLLSRREHLSEWKETPMTCINPGLTLWQGGIRLEQNIPYRYTIEAWTDLFETWFAETGKKLEAGQSIKVELLEGRALVADALLRAKGRDKTWMEGMLREFDANQDEIARVELLRSPLLRSIVARWPDRSQAVRYQPELEVIVDRIQARYAAWYEMFPRSQGTDPKKGSTFADCEARLPYVRSMGFDVLYLVPIHPIGEVNRKGPNNTLNPGPNDPGSPYAIGSKEGGHFSVHPELGTLDDFRHFVQAVHDHGMEVALDFAIQCAPDHPWVKEHPEWFTVRPDGTIKYAENPPKKYQDIVNVNFYGQHQDELWQELLNVVLFWVEQGVKIFRVDNPHTKPVAFWEWMIREVRKVHPEVLFLSEAFTKPPMLHLLAKAGFQQSYTYFTWRNFKHELTEYLTELSSGPGREYLRPNFFPTTPDILPHFLQTGGRPAFKIRLALAATLSSVYGMYNSYELCENQAVEGKEEYLYSEKYQFKVWDWDRPGNIRDYVTAINRIREENTALHDFTNLQLYLTDSEQVLFYGKVSEEPENILLIAVSLDPFDAQETRLHLPLLELGIPEDAPFEVEELFTGERHLWRGGQQFLRLTPEMPAVIFRVTPRQSVN